MREQTGYTAQTKSKKKQRKNKAREKNDYEKAKENDSNDNSTVHDDIEYKYAGNICKGEIQ